MPKSNTTSVFAINAKTFLSDTILSEIICSRYNRHKEVNALIKSNKNWKIHRPDEAVVESLMKELKLPSLHAKILASRGFQDSESVKKFLTTDATALHDPFLLYDMDKAVARIQAAIENGEHIVVYGDYDADGVTSVTVLTTALERIGAVLLVIPNGF